MRTGIKKKALPAECGSAWVVTVLLTVFLTLTLMASACLQMMTSAEMYLSVATDDHLVDRQMQEIGRNIDMMAEEYGFDAETMKTTVSREEMKEYNRITAEWWNHLLTEGSGGTFPRWYTGLIEDLIYAEAEEKELRENPQTIVTDLTKMIENTVFPIRETTMAFGTNLAKEKADIRGIVRSLRKLPTLGLMLSLACAGLIALLLGREPVRWLKHYGTATAAAGLTGLAGYIALLAAHPEKMIAEASAGLADQFATLAGKAGWRIGITAVILIAAGYICLFLYRRNAGKNVNEAGPAL